MSRTAVPPSLAAIDRRTLLARAKDELTESLREHGDATTIAIVLRFVDQLVDVTDRVLFRDYSAEKFAFCRVATEIEAAAARADLVWRNHISSVKRPDVRGQKLNPQFCCSRSFRTTPVMPGAVLQYLTGTATRPCWAADAGGAYRTRTSPITSRAERSAGGHKARMPAVLVTGFRGLAAESRPRSLENLWESNYGNNN